MLTSVTFVDQNFTVTLTASAELLVNVTFLMQFGVGTPCIFLNKYEDMLINKFLIQPQYYLLNQDYLQMTEFQEHIRTHFNVIHRGDYLSLTLINPNISAEIMTEIKQKFKLMSHIRREQIIIIEAANFDDELLIILAQSLPSSLTQLSLDFTGCESIKGSGLLDLFQKISEMQNLTKLHLDFSQVYDINDFVVEGLSMLLQNLSELTDFYLDLYEVDQISEQGYLILAESFNNMKKLEKFHLDLSANPNLTQDSLELLFSNLPKSLTYLGFRILDIEHIGGGSFFKLAQSISNMKSLSQLNLTISTLLNLNQKGVYSIFKAIGSINTLVNVFLNFSNINLPEKMLSFMSFAPHLENLSLDFSCNTNISDRDIASLTQKIPVMNRLKSVTLNWDFCKKVSEQALQVLIQRVCQNKSLIRVSLPDRKYSLEFIKSCVNTIQTNACHKSIAIFNCNGVQDMNKKEELGFLLNYKNREKMKRNIIYGTYLMQKNKNLHNFSRDIVKLFLP